MMPRRLGTLLGIAMALLLMTSTAAMAADQVIASGAVTTEGSIQVTVRDNGMTGIYRSDGANWIEQVYDGDNKYSMLFLAGTSSEDRYTTTDAASEWDPFSPYFTPVSNTTSGDALSIVTVLTAGSTGVRLTQTVWVVPGASYIKIAWAIANQGDSTFSDLRFINGEDTYFAGDDSGAGFWSDSQRMVYVRNSTGGANGLMGFYTDAANTPAFYHEGYYGDNYDMMLTGTLDNTVDLNLVDSGYSLGWTRPTLAPGATWNIEAYEKFVYSADLQVIAPSEQTANPGDEVLYPFTVSYFGTSFLDPVDLTAVSEHGWPVEVRDSITGDPISSVSFDGADSIDVIVAITVPADAVAGTRDLLTLTASYAGSAPASPEIRVLVGALEASDSTTTVVAGEAPAPSPSPSPNLTLQSGGLGNGWFGSCGMVVGNDGKGPMSGAESAGMIALYFALLLLPVGILKLVCGKKRFPFEKAGIVALFIAASMLVASSAHAVRLIAPKAQRFHPTMDGLGALTVDTDQTLCPGQFNFGTIFSDAKKPLNMGDINELRVQKVIVDELYTADLTAAYGITPDITLGLDVPIDYSRNNLNYARYRSGGAEVRDDVFHLGDIRANAKFRVIDGGRYGLALIPFVNFDTGDKDYLLSEGKTGWGAKIAGHLDVARPVTLYANLGLEHIGGFVSTDNPNYYTPWIQYGVGAKFLLPRRNASIVAEVNGETPWATPYRHSTLSPLEILAAYRTEIAPGWTLQAGGGGGLNKGMGAPQWRAILGLAYKN